MEFERDVYDYAANISCDVSVTAFLFLLIFSYCIIFEVHEELAAQNHCSKSIVTRMAYIICDNCCNDLNIELIPGRHIPYFKSEAYGTTANTESCYSDYVN